MKKHKYKLLTVSVLLAIATFIIYLINKFIFATAILKDVLKSTADNYYKWRFGKVYFKKYGSGTPVLLVHDLNVYSSAYEWNKVIDDLSKEHTVYAIDLPGCGRSDKQKITYTNFMYVQLLSDFIKNVIGEKTDIIASGFSGSFCIMACYNESNIFGSIILINPPSLSSLNKIPDKKSKINKFLLEIPVFGTLVYNMITCQSNIHLLFTEKYFYNPFSINAEMLDSYYEASHKGNKNAKYLMSSIIGKYVNNNINHALKDINQSIFIIEGEWETERDETITQYVQCNPAIETFILKKTKHLPQLESPDILLEQIQIFLS